MEAKVIPVQDYPTKERVLNEHPTLQALYSIADGIMEVMYLKDACATFIVLLTHLEQSHFK